MVSNSGGDSDVTGDLTVGGDITSGGNHVPVVYTSVPGSGALPGDILVIASPLSISIYGGSPGAWNQVFPAVYS